MWSIGYKHGQSSCFHRCLSLSWRTSASAGVRELPSSEDQSDCPSWETCCNFGTKTCLNSTESGLPDTVEFIKSSLDLFLSWSSTRQERRKLSSHRTLTQRLRDRSSTPSTRFVHSMQRTLRSQRGLHLARSFRTPRLRRLGRHPTMNRSKGGGKQPPLL